MKQAIDFIEYAQEVSTETRYCYPNKMGRIILTACNLADFPHLVDNCPSNNLKRSFSFDEFGAIQQAL